MTNDLPTRLLAAIQAAEKSAQDCIDEVGPERTGDRFTDDSGDADRDAFPSYPWGSDERELAFMAGPGHPDSVSRICQAHREIVELCTAVTADNSAPAAVLARLTLRLLAGGYGLKEEA